MINIQLKSAFFDVWIILSFLILVILIGPFVFSADSIYSVTSKLQTEHKTKCLLCGMTTSFIKISKGEFDEAISVNKYGIYLFVFLLVNELIFFYILARKFKQTFFNCN